MTKADKIDAILALVMVAICAAMGRHLRGNSLLFTVGFPATMYALYFWLRRAAIARMEDIHDENIAVFNRQLVMRLLFGFAAGSITVLLWFCTRSAMATSSYDGLSRGDYILIYSTPAILLGPICLCFLWGAGPYQVRLDLRRRRYSFTQGFPVFPLTKYGSTDGSVLYVIKTRSGQYQVRFRPPAHKWGYLLDTHGTDDAARTQAWQLANALGLSVERRDIYQAG